MRNHLGGRRGVGGGLGPLTAGRPRLRTGLRLMIRGQGDTTHDGDQGGGGREKR